MTGKRITGAKYHGQMVTVEDGRRTVDRYLIGIPARDLDEQDIKDLYPEDYATLVANMKTADPLYTEKGSGKKDDDKVEKTPAKKRVRKPAAKKPTTPVEEGTTPGPRGPEVISPVDSVAPKNGVEATPVNGPQTLP